MEEDAPSPLVNGGRGTDEQRINVEVFGLAVVVFVVGLAVDLVVVEVFGLVVVVLDFAVACFFSWLR